MPEARWRVRRRWFFYGLLVGVFVAATEFNQLAVTVNPADGKLWAEGFALDLGGVSTLITILSYLKEPEPQTTLQAFVLGFATAVDAITLLAIAFGLVHF